MKKLITISLILLFGCEQVVVIPLPEEQNLLVVEGWITDIEENQYVRLTRSNSFSGEVNQPVEDAIVTVQIRDGGSNTYSYTRDGRYLSNLSFRGIAGESYRLSVLLSNGDLLRSDWKTMIPRTEIVLLSASEFEETDEDNPGQTKTVFFPRITARDSIDYENYYRWVLLKNGTRLTEPESIILQNDRFFDGNFIPNQFDAYEYDLGDEMTVELHAIESNTYNYLDLLRAQTSTLTAAASVAPANVESNIVNLSDPDQIVLGYFGTTAVSIRTIISE